MIAFEKNIKKKNLDTSGFDLTSRRSHVDDVTNLATNTICMNLA